MCISKQWLKVQIANYKWLSGIRKVVSNWPFFYWRIYSISRTNQGLRERILGYIKAQEKHEDTKRNWIEQLEEAKARQTKDDAIEHY